MNPSNERKALLEAIWLSKQSGHRWENPMVSRWPQILILNKGLSKSSIGRIGKNVFCLMKKFGSRYQKNCVNHTFTFIYMASISWLIAFKMPDTAAERKALVEHLSGTLFFFPFSFVFGPHPLVFRSYSWLCAQGLFLPGLGGNIQDARDWIWVGHMQSKHPTLPYPTLASEGDFFSFLFSFCWVGWGECCMQ